MSEEIEEGEGGCYDCGDCHTWADYPPDGMKRCCYGCLGANGQHNEGDPCRGATIPESEDC